MRRKLPTYNCFEDIMKASLEITKPTQRINRLRDYFEMPVTPSLFIKSPIYTHRIDMCQTIKHIHPKKSGPIDLLRSYMKRIFKLLES